MAYKCTSWNSNNNALCHTVYYRKRKLVKVFVINRFCVKLLLLPDVNDEYGERDCHSAQDTLVF